ncbi:MAG: dihydropteroate synthase [Spirochaetes bacterium]|nr:dihydropteroate synthase [Spirochaetota bacterium]
MTSLSTDPNPGSPFLMHPADGFLCDRPDEGSGTPDGPDNRVIQWGSRWGSRVLDFRRKTYVMGILNCTPDSFHAGSRLPTLGEALLAADSMIQAGADILDVGGESTRPGSDPVPVEEEIRRVVPVIEAIRAAGDTMISVDTRNRETAERALDAGADIVNDISALSRDLFMARLVAERGVPVVLMHMRGTPKTMQDEAIYDDAVADVLRELGASISAAVAAGISPLRIIVDPGIGFSKKTEDNLRLIRGLAAFRSLGMPILIGLSRKRFIGDITGRPVEERLAGTVAANTLAVLAGADIVRVHDVAEAVAMVRIIDAVLRTAP